MKTVIRLRDDQGRIVGTARKETIPEPIEVLWYINLVLVFLGLALLWITKVWGW